MPRYLTSIKQKLTKVQRKYSVLYEDPVEMREPSTFQVSARSMSEAITLVMEYIERHKFHWSGTDYYFLTPSLLNKDAKVKPTYIVN